MRLTKQTNYAVRMLMYCAANDGSLSRIPEIARAYGVSELFLFKILQPLTRAGLVETVRGRNGGVRLAKPATDISLFDVVRVTEDSFAMAECFEDGVAECPLVDSCGLNSALRKALNAFFDVLADYSIDDIVKARPQINFLLGLTDHDHKAIAKKPVVAAPAA
jgi:Rrf2 family iron-responsive transcriptional regulator